jgi:restriction system protein
MKLEMTEAIPDFQKVMLPLLEFAGDGQEYSLRQTIDALANKLGLSTDDRRKLLPSGQQRVLDNRVSWARTYLTKAGLLRQTRRGYYAITERGRHVLGQNLTGIDIRFLNQFEDFRAFRTRSGPRNSPCDAVIQALPDETTPEGDLESLELAYGRLRDTLPRLRKTHVATFRRSITRLP